MSMKTAANTRRRTQKSARRYVLELSGRQAQLISHAVELFARLGMGQFGMLDRFFSWDSKGRSLERARPLLEELTVIKNGAPHCYPGIHSKEISDDYRVLYDLHQVIRHRLAWDRDRHPEGWKGVDYYEPSRASATEGLARIERLE